MQETYTIVQFNWEDTGLPYSQKPAENTAAFLEKYGIAVSDVHPQICAGVTLVRPCHRICLKEEAADRLLQAEGSTFQKFNTVFAVPASEYKETPAPGLD